MQPWEVVDFEGCLYYAFIAADQIPSNANSDKLAEFLAIQKQSKGIVNSRLKKDKRIKFDAENNNSDGKEFSSENDDECEDVENSRIKGLKEELSEAAENERAFDEVDGSSDDAKECIIEALDEYYVIKVKSESAALEKHDSSKGEIYFCQICNVCFSQQDMLERHKRSVHGGAKRKTSDQQYQCPTCSKVCRSLTSFQMHTSLVHNKGKSAEKVKEEPKHSGAPLENAKSPPKIGRNTKRRATEKVEAPNEFACDICEFKCQNKRRLKEHLERRHASEYKYECEFCGKKFKVKGDMRLHVRFKHKESPIVCDVCGKTCSNSNSLYVHQKWAHFKPKFECDICKRRMVTQENLDQHILLQHERRERFVCEECGKPFQENHRLKQHMMTHTGDRPYDCHICGKAFARRTAYRQHLLIHTGQRPYVCDICGKSFTQKPGLICHRKSHPGVHPPLPVVHIDHILNDFMKKD